MTARAALRWSLAAVAAGALLGIGGRGVMRLVALAAGSPGSFSVGGSAEVVLFGIALGAPVALAFFALRRYVRLPVPLAGIVLGLALFAILALVPPPAARSALAGTADPPILTALLFGALFAAYGGSLDWWWSRHRTRLTGTS